MVRGVALLVYSAQEVRSMKMLSKISFLSLVIVLAVGACDQGTISAPDGPEGPGVTAVMIPGAADLEEFEVCKYGASATFDYTVDDLNPSNQDASGSFTLADGHCRVLAVAGGLGANVSVTETGTDMGYTLDRVDVTTVDNGGSAMSTVSGPTVAGKVAGGPGGGPNGILAEYYNVALPSLPGRFTGGGSFFEGHVRFTHGFELHCDAADLPNNLEVNWHGERFHLTSLTSAFCFDDPNLNPVPPPAGFDTYVGAGVGLLKGVPGATISFWLTDDGEPGTSDFAWISITPPGGGTPIVADNFLVKGNHQAHDH
jgi:hypothetical protein